MLDLINSGFVLAAVAAALNDLLRLRRDRSVRGVTFATAALYTCWPLWDCYYLSNLKQFWSCSACVLLILFRATWLVLALRFEVLDDT